MKKKKQHPGKMQPDRYKDGPRKPVGGRMPRSQWDDDESIDDALEEWEEMRSWTKDGDFDGDEEE